MLPPVYHLNAEKVINPNVDYRSMPQLQALGCPVIFDATHAVQQAGGRRSSSVGLRKFVAPLARGTKPVGADDIFIKVTLYPEQALSDGPNMVPLQCHFKGWRRCSANFLPFY